MLKIGRGQWEISTNPASVSKIFSTSFTSGSPVKPQLLARPR